MSDSDQFEITASSQILDIAEPVSDKRLLNPVDRISEILFGLIMALTFTCTISVIESDRLAVKDMLIGALGCNVAWGLVDAVMFIIITMTEKSRSLSVYTFVRKTKQKDKAHSQIKNALPGVFNDVLKQNEIEIIRQRIVSLPGNKKEKLKLVDFKMALGVFILVFISTFPVALPFVFIEDVERALRLSNLVAIITMFLCGWKLAKYSGRNAFVMGTVLSLIGVALVLITIALGG